MKLSLNFGSGKPVPIYSDSSFPEDLNDFIGSFILAKEKIFILADENTYRHCLPVLLSETAVLNTAVVFVIKPGEKNKNPETAGMIWNFLAENDATRHSLLINIGGGVVTDLGGFAASTFKRGIPFIHVPTTLLAMADAAIGGKTGINLGDIKNQVGTFQNPEAVFIHPGFLRTLNNYEVLGGLAEIIKIALISDANLWDNLCSSTLPGIMSKDFSHPAWEELISSSIALKCSIVEKDFRENGIREILNFGHTIGHAFESLSLQDGRKALSHGHAVALGMICEGYLSSLKTGLAEPERETIISMILSGYEYYPVKDEDQTFLSDCILHDKKRTGQDLRFSLLERPGKAIHGITCNLSEILESVNFYRNLER
ncbi:MAG: 3-dehydroquinate synthase [Bacteroidetes bacterium]|nr:3-dehydroquinate synthase [Bacteroidota bacterium]